MKSILLFLLFSVGMVFCSQAQTDKQLVNDALRANLPKYQLSQDDINNYIITDAYTSKHNGVKHVYLRQTVNGIEIFNANPSLHFDANGNLIQFNNAFVSNASSLAAAAQPKLSYANAVQEVASALGVTVNFSLAKTSGAANEWTIIDKEASSENIVSELYYLLQDGRLKLVWNVEFYNDKTGDWWNKRVDATSGGIIDENNWTTHCNFDDFSTAGKTGNSAFEFEDSPGILSAVFSGKTANTAFYRAFPIPIESPAKGTRQLIESPATALASPFGWHDTDGVAGPEFTITRGNNTWTKEDTLANNGSGYSPNAGSSLVFDYSYNVSATTELNLDGAITNLFYWNNIIHDIFFHYGFDEESGNFQARNYSGKGLGNDFVNADAQDGSGTNNSNFSAPPDGKSGRMQMFLWYTNVNNKILYVTSPNEIQGSYTAVMAGFGPKKVNPLITAQVVLARDSSSADSLGCAGIANVNEIAGNIALIYRGTCTYSIKVQNAQNAGAIAVIVVNNTNGSPFTMTGSSSTITIPSIMVSKQTGDSLNKYQKLGSVFASIGDTTNSPTYDADVDNGIITHEYGHGISNRLTGGPSTTSCLSNTEQAGEGWSDFFALALTARKNENPQVGRGMATFVVGQDSTGVGIRQYRYSRNMSVDPLTYDAIKTAAVPHGLGFVWCTMLYDMLWDLCDRYGFDEDLYNGKGGNNIAIQLVIDGLKLQPCNPGFVDARNAILLADKLNNKGANLGLLWKTFARRGLGASANQGSSGSRSDGTQAFDVPTDSLNTSLENIFGEEDFRIYPNPSNGNVNIDFFSNKKVTSVEVYDVTGKFISSENTENCGSHFLLNLEGNPQGFYFIRINSAKGSITKKISLY